MRSKRWNLTVHGANPNGNCPILERLKSFFQTDKCSLAAVAYETGKQGIHPHWQIYFETAQSCRMKIFIAELLGQQYDFHLEVANGTR